MHVWIRPSWLQGSRRQQECTLLNWPNATSVLFAFFPGWSKKQGSSWQCIDRALYCDHGPCIPAISGLSHTEDVPDYDRVYGGVHQCNVTIQGGHEPLDCRRCQT